METKLETNLAFHALLEKDVCQLEFGQIDVSVIIRDGMVILPTMNVVKSKRIKFKDGGITTKYDE